MPLGSTDWQQARQRPITPAGYTGGIVTPVDNATQPPLAPSQLELLAGADFWQSYTIPTTAQWNPARIDFGSAFAVKLEIYAAVGDEIFIALESEAGITAGSYHLFHPGGGVLVRPIPPTRYLTLRVDAAGTAPTNAVEVTAMAGAYVAM